MKTVVVYVHGLWMTGFEGVLLRRRLARELDARAPRFSYSSIRAGISANARSLEEMLEQLHFDTLHLVGHSLGGLVILKLFEQGGGKSLPPGRVVFLGSPLGGSRAAHSLTTWKIGNAIMGRSVREERLQDRTRRWVEARDLGVIAGTLNLGLGRLVNRHADASDGTIFVDETRIEGMKAHLIMNVSHSGMPFSIAVAKQIATFLRSGTFSPL